MSIRDIKGEECRTVQWVDMVTHVACFRLLSQCPEEGVGTVAVCRSSCVS